MDLALYKLPHSFIHSVKIGWALCANLSAKGRKRNNSNSWLIIISLKPIWVEKIRRPGISNLWCQSRSVKFLPREELELKWLEWVQRVLIYFSIIFLYLWGLGIKVKHQSFKYNDKNIEMIPQHRGLEGSGWLNILLSWPQDLGEISASSW